LFGPRVIPFLKSALSEALTELKNIEASSERSYYRSGNATEAPERAITCLVTAMGIISVPSTVPDIVQTLPRTDAFEALAKIGNKQALDAVVPLIPAWFAKNVRSGGYDEDDREAEMQEVAKTDGFLRKI
jgi:hypothetical protein